MQITKAVVLKEVLKWRKLLDLEAWDFTIKTGEVDENNFAECAATPAYLRAELGFNLDNIKDMKTLRKKVIHELLHVTMSQYTDTADVFAGSKKKILSDLEENLVTRMERWELWGKVK